MPFLDQKKHIKNLLLDYQNQIEKTILQTYGLLQDQDTLAKAFYYALSGPGKRFRPCITLIVADFLNNGLDVSCAALAVELFHTASLVADDLPSMDDDAERRERPSLHKVYGDDVALLTSYALIGEGYQCVLRNKESLKGQLEDLNLRGDMAILMLAQNNGLQGAPSGQLFDLYPPVINQESLDLIFYRKTVLFFETAFVLGWLFGGGDLQMIDKLKKCAYHFGMAFQIYDDFCDIAQDEKKDKKINYPLALGTEKSLEILKGHIDECGQILKELQLDKKIFNEMLNLLALPLYS